MTASMPLVTVGVTTYNRSNLLRCAIDSVLVQTYGHVEVYVVDDNSADGTRETVTAYDDSRITYLRNDCNLGVSACRNRILELALGKYVAFLDDDDTWSSEKLERQVFLAETRASECAIIYCGCVVIGQNRSVVNMSMPKIRGRIRSAIAAGRLVTIPSSHLFRTEKIREIGGYDTSLRSHEEHDIWMAMARRDCTADYVNDVLVTVGAHLGYRLTADVVGRWTATDTYLAKWRPWLINWMGHRGAVAYEQRYRVKVMSGVSREAIARSDLRGLLRAWSFVLRRWPNELTTISVVRFILRTAAGVLVDRVPRIRRVLSHGGIRRRLR